MSEIIDDIRTAREAMPALNSGDMAHHYVQDAQKATRESTEDGYYVRESLVRAAAQLIVAIEILDRADEERR